MKNSAHFLPRSVYSVCCCWMFLYTSYTSYTLAIEKRVPPSIDVISSLSLLLTITFSFLYTESRSTRYDTQIQTQDAHYAPSPASHGHQSSTSSKVNGMSSVYSVHGSMDLSLHHYFLFHTLPAIEAYFLSGFDKNIGCGISLTIDRL